MSELEDMKKALAEAEARAEEAEARADAAEQRAEARAEEAEARADAAEQRLKVNDLQASGKYWDTFDKVWTFKRVPYEGSFAAASRLRQVNHCDLYEIKNVKLVLSDGRDVEAVLHDKESPSVFEADDETTVSTVSCASLEKDRSNRTGDQKHERTHARNMLGKPIRGSDKTRAHTFPKDTECNDWWWPEYKLVTGVLEGADHDAFAVQKLASMRTSKFIFGGQHNHIYDDLKDGVVCTIPIFESLEAMANWKYQQRYKMLIVADSARTYENLQMLQESKYPHIRYATAPEVKYATDCLAEMTKVLADSLDSNWDDHYSKLDGPRKQMLELMLEMLRDDERKVDIPDFAASEGQTPALYLIDYEVLYQGNPEGHKYIMDPFPALIKSAMNLSSFTTKNNHHSTKYEGCKLLPGCSSSESPGGEESELSTDITWLFSKRAPATSFEELIGREIELPNFVSEDEDTDDNDTDDWELEGEDEGWNGELH